MMPTMRDIEQLSAVSQPSEEPITGATGTWALTEALAEHP
jgi:hypothetical protein